MNEKPWSGRQGGCGHVVSPPLRWLALAAALALAGCKTHAAEGPHPDKQRPEKLVEPRVERTVFDPKSAADLPPTDTKLLDGMDNGVALTAAERRGRNAWILWTAGNHRFWDHLARNSFGLLDLLKTLSIPRDKRFALTGMINEPGMKARSAPDEYGFTFDEWDGPPPADQPDPKIYGRSSGVVGLRLFDNPEFDEKARKRWNPKRYFSDPVYASDPTLVRPYAVGMSCGFCHVSFHPQRPPADVSNPKYENLSSNIGAEYLWVSRVFGHDLRPSSFAYQLMESNPPGALDTSLIASDSINGPRTMNAVFEIGGRLAVAKTLGANEAQQGDTLLVPGVKHGVPGVQEGLTPEGLLNTPHILKDGADSVGLAGALARVFINIGEYHQEWIKHFKPLIGGTQTPMDVASANAHSPYWNATAERLPDLAAFFLKSAGAMHLEDAPGGKAYLTEGEADLTRGKLVFAEHCAACHSSKQPPGAPPNHGYFDAAFERWTQSPAYKAWMKAEVVKPDFRVGNYFSTDMRVSIKRVGTNACAAVGSNAIRGHIWDAFSSETYKTLPAVGQVDVINPITGKRSKWTVPAGGRGYLRSPSLVSLWTSAPFFVSNTLGELEYAYDTDGRPLLKPDVASVEARMRVFDASIKQLLWPETRAKDPILGTGRIMRTTEESFLIVSAGSLPPFVRDALAFGGKTEVKIGPFPKGTPINLIANIDVTAGDPDSQASKADLVKAAVEVGAELVKIKLAGLDEKKAVRRLEKVVPTLLKVNKCPDFEFNRGHLYGTNLSDADKNALIGFLKTL